MASFEQDAAYLKAAADELEPFLLSDEIHWPLSPAPGGGLSRLSLGSLLLGRARLCAVNDPRLAALEAPIEAVRAEWRTHWERKAQRESGERLNLWANFLSDLQDRPDRTAGEYPQEVRNRVMLDLLLAEANLHRPAEAARLDALDGLLRQLSQPGPFVWPAELEAGFPESRFWYLYRRFAPKSKPVSWF